ncbi:D-serine/D-alanine/glycine transporter [Corynebacterium glutamicum]|nr:D-serine/D-alanine/glycine transporter [Corynebacterium glutamicum]AST19762.1 D-serine/D-alanine/glycine transporter [Corynebacterium glutamicum ATCC 14067]QXU47192.1 D-serine/D-alanine/glycine transporter [[Brevibacterium] flavum]QDQ20069.1 D-serine/D-alanine/glycine transporter [Corynebacterium glutamicum]QDQ23636.1 D-serine/D-alanine/glycine transporter [Corynebacterium glutamicum]QJS17612.1 D-serine/D-alanine/glycine transporter [Corynebacterium glutamicum]
MSDSAVQENHEPHLKRGLSNRHLQLIAIGGAIGTGLFMGSGKTISVAGPSVILVYAIIGFMLFFVMRAMGELLLANLNYKSLRDAVSDILGPGAGFVTGWTYWFCWIATGMADIVAITGYTQYWWPEIPLWLPGVLTIALLFALNLAAVRLFGEMEFWFAIIKIVAIVSLIVVGLFMVVTAFESPNGTTAQFNNLIEHGGFFPNGITGFLAGFQIAIFAFVGIELAGTAAAETENPTKTLPRAINSIPIRIVVFYVLALAVIMMVTPWDQVSADNSPFVQMFALAGIPAAAGIINFVVITSAASSANSGIFSTSRMLYGLSLEGAAPKRWSRLSKNLVPARGLTFSVICLIPAVGLLYAGGTVIEAFTLITTVSSVLFMVVWSYILVAYIVYRRNSPELHKKSIFKMPGGVVMAVVVLVFFAAMLVVLSLEPDTRAALIATPVWFIILGIGWLSIGGAKGAKRRSQITSH